MKPKKPRKRKTKPANKILQEQCECAWKQVVEERDGRQCMVKKFFPEINITHTPVYQADHCFTRGNKHLFLDPCNGTMVCASCNMAKHYDNKSVKRAVDMIVRAREGEKKWGEMLRIDMGMSANHDFNKVWWLEAQLEGLTMMLKPKEDECQDDTSHGG